MKINECSYCGMTAFSDEGICPACQAALGQSEIAQNPVSETEYAAETFPVESFPQSFESANYADNSQTEFASANVSPRRNAFEGYKRCAICNAGIAQYREVCSRCTVAVKPDKKKSGFGKFATAFVFLILIVGGFYYLREDTSPAGILRKFEKATGTSKNLVFETFVMKGESTISITGARSPGPITQSNPISILATEKYYFDMSFKNPSKILLDFYKISVTPNSPSHESAYMQGFNGTNGWTYTNIFNQPARLEDGGDAFGDKRMGLGLEEYESVEALSEAKRAEYGDELIKSFDTLKTFEVDGAQIVSEKKSYLLARKTKADGKTDESLLIFDEKSGFLVGLLKKDIVNGTPVVTKIFADIYKKFWVKEKGYFGVGGKFVLMPTIWKFIMGLPKSAGNTSPMASVSVTIELKVESLTTDVAVDDTIFEKPSGK